jgi:hypothetical protein
LEYFFREHAERSRGVLPLPPPPSAPALSVNSPGVALPLLFRSFSALTSLYVLSQASWPRPPPSFFGIKIWKKFGIFFRENAEQVLLNCRNIITAIFRFLFCLLKSIKFQICEAFVVAFCSCRSLLQHCLSIVPEWQ